MSREVGKGLQVLLEINLVGWEDRISVLGCNGLSKLVVVECPETLGGTIEADLFLRNDKPLYLPATIGDLLLALERYRVSLGERKPLLSQTEVENVKHLQKAYRRAL